MTARTKKTLMDLVVKLKEQEKEIKADLTDCQRRLNEIRDRIATIYWVEEELSPVEKESVEKPSRKTGKKCK